MYLYTYIYVSLYTYLYTSITFSVVCENVCSWKSFLTTLLERIDIRYGKRVYKNNLVAQCVKPWIVNPNGLDLNTYTPLHFLPVIFHFHLIQGLAAINCRSAVVARKRSANWRNVQKTIEAYIVYLPSIGVLTMSYRNFYFWIFHFKWLSHYN